MGVVAGFIECSRLPGDECLKEHKSLAVMAPQGTVHARAASSSTRRITPLTCGAGVSLKALILLVLVGASLVPWHGSAATNWTRLAVMPFRDVTRDKALEPWRRAFASWVSGWVSTAQPFQFDVLERDEVLSALTNSGWQAEQDVSEKMACQVAAALRCSTVVLGEFSRSEGLWRVKLRLVRPASAEPERSFQVENRSTDRLLLQLMEKTCDALNMKPAAALVSLMRDYPVSDGAWDKLVRLEEAGSKNDTGEEYVQALREILASDPNCFQARSRLARTLSVAQKPEEALAESRKLVQQAPGLCAGYIYLALSLQDSDPEQARQREEGLLTALKAHPGCPSAGQLLFLSWSQQERWEDIRRVAAEAHDALPAETGTSAYLALAQAKLGDRKGARLLLSEIDPTRDQSPLTHIVLLQAGVLADMAVMGRELVWLRRLSETNAAVGELVAQVDNSFWLEAMEGGKQLDPPRAYTAQELQVELEKRLTPEERALAVSPIAVTEEIEATARQLTEGLTNTALKVAMLFAHVAGQRLQADAVCERSQAKTGPQLACHYYASQLVALVRAIGVTAWLAHVDLNEDQGADYHDRAALMIGGRLLFSDPTWNLFLLRPSEDLSYRVLDDLQAIAHHLCQTSSAAAVRASLKLDPDDVWTRIVSAAKLAGLGQLQEAETRWQRLPPECTNRWDYHFARGIIDAEKGDYAAALKSLLRADQLGPNNAKVEFHLGLVYGSLKDDQKAAEHMEKALKLGAARYVSGDREDLETRVTILRANAIPGDMPLDELRSRAQAGDLAARTVLVNRLFKRGPQGQDEALGLLRQMAEEGNAVVQSEYARNLLLLRGPKAAEEAVGFFRRAARQGNPEAQYHLGVLLYAGKVVPKDEVEAAQWMHLAAQTRHNDARSVLKEMELFLDSAAFAEGRKRAAEFKPVPEERNTVRQERTP